LAISSASATAPKAFTLHHLLQPGTTLRQERHEPLSETVAEYSGGDRRALRWVLHPRHGIGHVGQHRLGRADIPRRIKERDAEPSQLVRRIALAFGRVGDAPRQRLDAAL
jgi:hypothetical protein